MHKIFIIIYCGIYLLLASCAVYKIDVQQGNLVTQEMLDQLELNLPVRKVRFIMGSPLMIDTFHQERWDYIYSVQPGGGERQQRKITLFFDENKLLKRVEGDVKIGKRQPQKPVPLPGDFDQEPIL
jgi:outer membrane protein assembly factor BamE